jgi:hypothetical protein
MVLTEFRYSWRIVPGRVVRTPPTSLRDSFQMGFVISGCILEGPSLIFPSYMY